MQSSAAGVLSAVAASSCLEGGNAHIEAVTVSAIEMVNVRLVRIPAISRSRRLSMH